MFINSYLLFANQHETRQIDKRARSTMPKTKGPAVRSRDPQPILIDEKLTKFLANKYKNHSFDDKQTALGELEDHVMKKETQDKLNKEDMTKLEAEIKFLADATSDIRDARVRTPAGAHVHVGKHAFKFLHVREHDRGVHVRVQAKEEANEKNSRPRKQKSPKPKPRLQPPARHRLRRPRPLPLATRTSALRTWRSGMAMFANMSYHRIHVRKHACW